MASEDVVEEAGIEILKDLGWLYLYGASIASDGLAPQRRAFSDVIMLPGLKTALTKLIPDVPEAARNEAIRRLLTSATGSLVEEMLLRGS